MTRIDMKKISTLIFGLVALFPALSLAGLISTRSTAPTTCAVGDIWINPGAATNDRIYTCTSTNTWTKNSGRPWVIQSTAPSDLSLIWFDDDQVPGYLVLKLHNGTTWVEQAMGEGSGTTYTAGTGIDITGGVISSTVTGTLPSGIEGQTIQYGSGGTPAAVDLAPLTFVGSNISYNSETGLATVPVTATATSGSDVPFTSGGAYTALGGKQDADADLTTAAGATGAGNSKYFGTNSGGIAGFYDLPTGGSGSFTFDTFPSYEDSAHSSGIAVNGTTLAVYSSTAGKWLTVGLTDTLNAAPVTYAATLTITDASATGDTFTLNSIAYDVADSPVSVTDLPTATEQITYTGINTAACTGDVTGTGPWTINTSPATVGCTVTVATSSYADNFNRANQEPLVDGIDSSTTPTGTWAGTPGFGSAVRLATNRILPSATFSADASIYSTRTTWSNNQYSQCKLLDPAIDAGPAVRLPTSGTVRGGYMLSPSGTTTVRVIKFAPIASVVTGSTVTVPAMTSSTVGKISVIGDQIYVYLDGVLVTGYPVTDTSIASGAPGVIFRAASGQVDDWVGGNK